LIIGLISWKLEILGAQSLKEKRSVVKSLKDRLRDKFNVSVAETGHQDVWQVCELTACAVAATKVQAEDILRNADELVATEYRARIISAHKSYV
jgi:uncharacterized protein